MNRRKFVMSALGSFGALSVPAQVAANSHHVVSVYKSPSCGCCGAWVKHMQQAGFTVHVRDIDMQRLNALKTQMKVAPDLAGCHTALTESYVIEGHVPANDVLRLLDERPYAIGLSVPGMPIGSPGMEMGDEREPFDTRLMLHDGSSELFTKYI